MGTQARALQNFEQSVAYYGADPLRRRGVHSSDLGNGYFWIEIGTEIRNCDNGRNLVNPKDAQKHYGVASLPGYDDDDDAAFQMNYRPEARGFPKELWIQRMMWHDEAGNWDLEGNVMSAKGRAETERIRQWIRDNISDDEDPWMDLLEEQGGAALAA